MYMQFKQSLSLIFSQTMNENRVIKTAPGISYLNKVRTQFESLIAPQNYSPQYLGRTFNFIGFA